MTSLRITLLAVAVSCIASRAAAQTTIDFDGLAASSCVYASAPALDTQFAAMGVTFSGDISTFPVVVPASCLTIAGASTPNIVALSGAGRYLRADFAPATTSVSMHVGNYNRIETFTLTAYDASDAVIATSTVMPSFRNYALITVSASGIAYVVLSALHSENAIDDVTFASSTAIDAGTDLGPPAIDAGADDGLVDLGTPDDGLVDLGTPDDGLVDLGTPDTGAVDAGGPDAATIDGGTTDAGLHDAGPVDAGARDATAHDAGGADAGTTTSHGGCCGIAGAGSREPWLLFLAPLALVALRRTRRRRL